MKYKTLCAVALLLGAATVAAAVPDQPFMQSARADLQTAKRELHCFCGFCRRTVR